MLFMLKIKNAKRGLFNKKMIFFFKNKFMCFWNFEIKIWNAKTGGLFYKKYFFSKFLLSACGVCVENQKRKEGTLLKKNYFFFKHSFKCFWSFCLKSKMQRTLLKKKYFFFIVSFKCFWSLCWKSKKQRGDSS